QFSPSLGDRLGPLALRFRSSRRGARRPAIPGQSGPIGARFVAPDNKKCTTATLRHEVGEFVAPTLATPAVRAGLQPRSSQTQNTPSAAAARPPTLRLSGGTVSISARICFTRSGATARNSP